MGATALAGWMSGRLVFASAHPSFIPMAPLTATAFVLLAAALILLPRHSAGAVAAAAVVGCVGVVRVLAFALQGVPVPDVEAVFVRDAGTFGGVPLARVSPVTAAALSATATAVVLLATRRRVLAHVAGWLSACVIATGGTVLLGYAYGTPLLYGGTIIPVALPTGAGLTVAGIGSLAAAGPRAWPLRAFRGANARARLLRAFLPPTAAALLLASAPGRILTVSFHANPALAAALSTLAALILVSGLVWRTSRTVGGAIDEAKQALTRSRNQLEHAVDVRTAELARINQELDAFTSSVSHDLRAPLRHMIGFATLLDQTARDQLSPQASGHVKRIVEAGDRMMRLIDDLLAFARTAQAPLRSTRVELLPVIDQVMRDLDRDLDARVIEWDVRPLPAVRGDGALLRQAFANVLGNAVKYTKTRERARIEIGATAPTATECVVYVRDNGVGFDAAYTHKLFGVFQRLHAAHEFEGTGIGLANVRRIIERHGGRTWAEGAVDQGATFFIALPLEGNTITS